MIRINPYGGEMEQPPGPSPNSQQGRQKREGAGSFVSFLYAREGGRAPKSVPPPWHTGRRYLRETSEDRKRRTYIRIAGPSSYGDRCAIEGKPAMDPCVEERPGCLGVDCST